MMRWSEINLGLIMITSRFFPFWMKAGCSLTLCLRPRCWQKERPHDLSSRWQPRNDDYTTIWGVHRFEHPARGKCETTMTEIVERNDGFVLLNLFFFFSVQSHFLQFSRSLTSTCPKAPSNALRSLSEALLRSLLPPPPAQTRISPTATLFPYVLFLSPFVMFVYLSLVSVVQLLWRQACRRQSKRKHLPMSVLHTLLRVWACLYRARARLLKWPRWSCGMGNIKTVPSELEG